MNFILCYLGDPEYGLNILLYFVKDLSELSCSLYFNWCFSLIQRLNVYFHFCCNFHQHFLTTNWSLDLYLMLPDLILLLSHKISKFLVSVRSGTKYFQFLGRWTNLIAIYATFRKFAKYISLLEKVIIIITFLQLLFAVFFHFYWISSSLLHFQ